MNKMFRTVSAATLSSLALVGAAQAAVPADVTTALADMKADGLAVATAFLIAIIAIAAFKLMRKGA